MRWGAFGPCAIFGSLGVVLAASPAAAYQDDLFSVVRQTPPEVVVTATSETKQTHFLAYRNAAPARAEAQGFGMYATAKGAAVDLSAPDQMIDGPSGSLFSQSAGLGWRNKNVSAMVGYMKPSSVKSATHFEDEHTPVYKTRARFGVGWALHF